MGNGQEVFQGSFDDPDGVMRAMDGVHGVFSVQPYTPREIEQGVAVIEAAKRRDVQDRFGMIPNLAGAMAMSPVLIKSFVPIFDQVHGGSFTEQQIQTVLLTDAVTNAGTWAVALHTALGLKAGLSASDVEAIRAGRSPSDKKLGAFSTLARTLIEKRGAGKSLARLVITRVFVRLREGRLEARSAPFLPLPGSAL